MFSFILLIDPKIKLALSLFLRYESHRISCWKRIYISDAIASKVRFLASLVLITCTHEMESSPKRIVIIYHGVPSTQAPIS